MLNGKDNCDGDACVYMRFSRFFVINSVYVVCVSLIGRAMIYLQNKVNSDCIGQTLIPYDL